ncbi:hypothetical protein E2562_008917 [Oryza meyeriana var. granulata]|uniref:Protein kinase domain-containing protein n=1 Tax=Oryza meyeriana var. granulata TaxID=110450 RepID=A0A6G1D0H2_9ORYZ|nr:hypothetical protein E2562_008917 [Oryza meyeriana var. granulata]
MGAFVLSPTKNLSTANAGQLGLLNMTDDGKLSNHVFAVELDTIMNPEFSDIDSNHVGIDVNNLTSLQAKTAGYYDDDGTGAFRSLQLNSQKPMQVWVDYDGQDRQLDVTLAPARASKPGRPLLSATVDLSSVMKDLMYVGDGRRVHTPLRPPMELQLGRSCSLTGLLDAAYVLLFVRWWRRQYAEVREDWEVEFGPHRFAYKDLFHATQGFADKNLLGVGGFGSVYKGMLPVSNLEIAVKRASHDSRQGMREFIAEVVSIGRIRHRNIVQLLSAQRRTSSCL